MASGISDEELESAKALAALALDSAAVMAAREEAVRSLAQIWNRGAPVASYIRQIATETTGKVQILAIQALGGNRFL